MEGAAVQTQHPREMDQGGGIQLHHVRQIVQPPHPRRPRQQIEAVQVVIGDDAALARLDAAFDVQQDFLGPHQVDGLAQDAHALFGAAFLPERTTLTHPPVGRGDSSVCSVRFLIHGLVLDAASQYVVCGCG
ncbi:hypothetical protein D3C71_1611600 [compost metagenome]